MAGVVTTGAISGGGNKVAGNTYGLTVTERIAAGSTIIIALACDNASATTPTASINNVGGVAPTQVKALSQNATSTAGSGTMLFVWTVVPTSDVLTSDAVTITLSNSVTAKAVAVEVFYGVGSLAGSNDTFSSSGVINLSSGGSPPAVDQLVVAIGAGEAASAPTSDTDTDNGEAWSNMISGFTTGGSAVTNISVGMQHKIATTSEAATWNTDINADAVATMLIFNTTAGLFTPRGTWAPGTRNAVEYGNGKFVSGTSGGDIYNSTVGRVWNQQTNPGTTSAINNIRWNGTRFFLTKSDGTLLTSTDGSAWSTTTAPSANRVYAIGYGNGLWVACDTAGGIYTAPDSATPTWTSRTNPNGTGVYRAYAYGNGVHVLMGEVGIAASSTDGQSWTTRTSSFTTSIIEDLEYDGATFVAVGSNGKIATSTTGTSWTQVTTTNIPSNNSAQCITKGPGGVWFVGAQLAVAVQSTDLITWTPVDTGSGGGTIQDSAASSTVLVVSGNDWYVRETTATPKTASDTLSASVTDASTAPVVTGLGITASDTLSASVTDTATAPSVRISVSDTLSASVTENRSFGTVAVTASDTLSTNVNDIGVLPPITALGSDTLTTIVTDARLSLVASVVASDTLSASVIENRSFGTVAVAASDTLSVSVDDSGSINISSPAEPIAGADTLSVVVTDAGTIDITSLQISASDILSASVIDDSVTIGKTLPGSDTLSLSVTETSGIEIVGTVTKNAADTLTAGVTEGAIVSFPLPGADQLIPVVTESSSLNITTEATQKSATDILTVTLETEQADVAQTTIGETPDIRIHTFSFPGGTEGFVATVPSNTVASWQSGAGLISGALQTRRSGKSLIPSQSYWQWTGTWIDLGIPEGSTIVSVRISEAWNSVIEYTQGNGVYVGPYQLFDASNSLLDTLWTGRAATAIDSGVAIGPQPSVTVDSSHDQPDDVIKIRLYNTIGTNNPANPAVTIIDDEINLEITYFPPFPQSVDDELFVSLTDVATPPVLVGQTKDASDTITLSVSETANTPVITRQNISAADTLSVQVTDASTAPVITRQNIAASDTLTASLTDTAAQGISINTSDTLSASITDSGRKSLGGMTWPMYDADFIYNTAAEYNGGGQLLKTASDTLIAMVTETRAFQTFAKTASDTLSVTLTENTSFATINIAKSDILAVTVADETLTRTVLMTASDSLVASVTEEASFSTTNVGASDTLSAAVTENRSFAPVQLAAADSLTATLTGEGVGGVAYQSAADILSSRIAEATIKNVAGTVSITTTDLLFANVTESILFGTISRTVSDTLSAAVTDASAIKTLRSASDTLSASVTETRLIAFPIVASDVLAARVTDAGVWARTSKYTVYIWNGTSWELTYILMWNGTAWIEPLMYRWNGVAWV